MHWQITFPGFSKISRASRLGVMAASLNCGRAKEKKMRKSTFMLLLGLILLASTLQHQAAFAGTSAEKLYADPVNGQSIYSEGKGNAAACQGCHGKKALGNDASGAPRLANIGQIYTLKQLAEFATDKRIAFGAGATMNGISKALNEQDRRDLVVYLDSLDYEIDSSDLKALAPKKGNVGDPKKGRRIVTKGIKGLVPACQNCHGLSGRPSNVPAIHQQKFVYIVNQLNSFRDGNRTNDPVAKDGGIMRGIAKKLTDENIADIAAFLSTLRSLTP